MDIYREAILDHYKHPRHFGHLDNSDVRITEGNVTCGDRVEIDVQFGTNGSTIKAIAFSGEGCAISQASASMVTEVALTTKTDELLQWQTSEIQNLLGTTLTPSRVRCATLALEVLQKAILSYQKDNHP